MKPIIKEIDEEIDLCEKYLNLKSFLGGMTDELCN